MDETGTSCTYSGSAGTNSISLNLQSCQTGAITGIPCSNGALRDIQLVAGAISGTVNGRITGTEAQTWNTFVSGTETGTGPMVLNGQFVINR